MAFKRKRTTSNRRFKRKAPARKYTRFNTRRLRTLIKRTVLKTCESKERTTLYDKVEMFHNVFTTYHINQAGNMPSQGTQEVQRIGDQINMSGFMLRCLFGQKVDRPNVTFRYFIVKVPKASVYSYATWFRNITSNVLLDNINTDFCKVLKTGVMRPNEAGLSNAGGDEYTFTRKFFIPYKKLIKFGPSDSSQTHNDDDIYWLIAPYDAFGTLITDNVAYMQAALTLYYKDP